MGQYSEYGKIEIGDKTLSERVEKTLDQLSSNPTASISAACQNPHQAKAVYRLLSNEKFTAEAVIAASRKETAAKIKESGMRVVLLPQDTTSINYGGLKETEGLGITNGYKNSRGILLHSSIAVSEEGQILGLLSEKAWVRPAEELGKRTERRKKPVEEKESNKWLETLDKTDTFSELNDVKFIHICDREGDLYELFAKAESDGKTYLCRRCRNRVIEAEACEIDINRYLSNLTKSGELTVKVPRDSHTNRELRTAKLELKYGKANMKKPVGCKQAKPIAKYVEVTLISAKEIDPPVGAKEINWELVTNDVVETFEDAVKCVNRYTQRWKIEIFHNVLKSGCAIEKLQASTAGKLIKLIALYSVISLRIMILTYLARTLPNDSCEAGFAADEWKILYKVTKKTKTLPDKPPTMLEAVIMLSKLGGFLARKSDGFPGVKVIWRGITAFDTILDAIAFLS